MSYQEWTIKGYGICTDKIEKTTMKANVEAMLALDPQYSRNLSELFSGAGVKYPCLDDYLYDPEGVWSEERLGLAELMSNVIYFVDGINLTACDDFEGSKYLLYKPSYPCASHSVKSFAAIFKPSNISIWLKVNKCRNAVCTVAFRTAIHKHNQYLL